MNKKLNLILIIVWMIFIFIMSSFNADTSSNQTGFIVNIISNTFNINNIDLITLIVRKFAHFTEYFVLGLLIYNYNKNVLKALIICIIYAISDEIHQLFILGRSFQIKDIIIDTLGSITGILFVYRCKMLNKR